MFESWIVAQQIEQDEILLSPYAEQEDAIKFYLKSRTATVLYFVTGLGKGNPSIQERLRKGEWTDESF